MYSSSNQLKLGNQEDYAFMTIIIKVYTSNVGWQKSVMKILKNIHGVNNFKMDESGIIEVSGKVTPPLLLKMLAKAGKNADVLWWQFGECSSNLSMPYHNNYTDASLYPSYGNQYGSSYYGDSYNYPFNYGGGPNNFRQRPFSNPFIGHDCDVASRGRQVHMVHGLQREWDNEPACCTIM